MACQGETRLGEAGKTRCRLVGCRMSRRGQFRQACLGKLWHDMARLGRAGCARSGENELRRGRVWRGKSWRVIVRLGPAGLAARGASRQGKATRVVVRSGRRGIACLGMASQGKAGTARRVWVTLGWSRTWFVEAGCVRLGKVRSGEVRQAACGFARLVVSGPGKVGQGRQGLAGLVLVGLASVGWFMVRQGRSGPAG